MEVLETVLVLVLVHVNVLVHVTEYKISSTRTFTATRHSPYLIL